MDEPTWPSDPQASEDPTATVSAGVAAGGRIVKPTFSFPGGRRFHFADPSNNELSVWSE